MLNRTVHHHLILSSSQNWKEYWLLYIFLIPTFKKKSSTIGSYASSLHIFIKVVYTFKNKDSKSKIFRVKPVFLKNNITLKMSKGNIEHVDHFSSDLRLNVSNMDIQRSTEFNS